MPCEGDDADLGKETELETFAGESNAFGRAGSDTNQPACRRR
jgi:hypothetical protein